VILVFVVNRKVCVEREHRLTEIEGVYAVPLLLLNTNARQRVYMSGTVRAERSCSFRTGKGSRVLSALLVLQCR
jgi:hypothetical protein